MSSTFYKSSDVWRRKNYQYVIARLRNSCLITFLKKYRSSQRRYSVIKGALKLHGKKPVLESFFNKVASLQPASFLKRLKHKRIPVKFAKLLKAPILKKICKRLSLEVFYKKAILKNFNIHRTKVATGKCSVKKFIYMLTPCGCLLQENTYVGVSF